MKRPINPVEVEEGIANVAERIENSVEVLNRAYIAFLDADRAFDNAYAHAYVSAKGSVEERKQRARLASMGEREARDIADAAHQYAKNRNYALRAELESIRSIGASVRSMYQVAGRGPGQ